MTEREQINRNEGSSADGAAAHGHALSTVIAKYVAGILIAGMAVYACVQYFLMPDETVLRLVFEHLGHVAFLMLLVYAMLYFVLLRIVVSPIDRFRAKLYRVAGGDLTPIVETSTIVEMQEMAGGINLMIERLTAGFPRASLGNLATQAANLRQLAQQSENLNLEQKQTLLNTAEETETLVALITKNVVRNSGASS